MKEVIGSNFKYTFYLVGSYKSNDFVDVSVWSYAYSHVMKQISMYSNIQFQISFVVFYLMQCNGEVNVYCEVFWLDDVCADIVLGVIFP